MKSVTPNDTTKGQSSPSRNGAGAVSAISQRSDSSPSSSIQQPSPQRIEKRKRGRPRKEHPIVQFPVQWEFRDGTVHHRHATGASSSNRSRSSSSSMGDSSIQIFNYYHDQASNHMQYCNLNEASPENYSSLVNHTSMTSSASMERSNPPPPPCSHPQRSVRQIFSFQNVNFPTLRKRSNSNKSGNSSPSKMSSSSTTSSNGSLHSNGGSSSSKKSPTRSSPISMTISNTTLFSTSTWNMTPQQQQQIQQHPSIVSNLANRTRTNSNNTFDPATLVTNSTTPVPLGNSSVSTFSIIAPSQGVESSFQQAIANTHEASSTPNPERKRPMKGRTHISLKDILN